MAWKKLLRMKLKSGFGCVDFRADFALLPNMNEESGLDDGFYPCTINDDNLFWGSQNVIPYSLPSFAILPSDSSACQNPATDRK